MTDKGSGRLGEFGDVALGEAHADHEVLILAEPKLLKTVAQSGDGRRGPP